MSDLTMPSEQRCLPVRLDRIRPEVRTAAARNIAQREPADGAECLYAALNPSDTTYYVALEAAALLERIAA